MQRKILLAVAALSLTATFLRGQDSICEVFKDLQAADGKHLIVVGELIIAKDFAALGAADCEARYATVLSIARPRVVRAWPTAVHLRPSEKVSAKQIQQFQAPTPSETVKKWAQAPTPSRSRFGNTLEACDILSEPRACKRPVLFNFSRLLTVAVR
jgi:hypothetical protein